MSNEQNEMLMSLMVDGELPSDQVNNLLLDVLDDAAEREKLKDLLGLRQATAKWRTVQPVRPVMIVSDRPRSVRPGRRLAWRAGGMAVAACIGGFLVLAGVWASGWVRGPDRLANPWQNAPGSGAPQAVAARVTPEQQQQIAEVFALHESVAGPLAWYASDDQNVRLASARTTEAGRTPIGVLLRLNATSNGSGGRTLVIVCRNDEPAVIELPAESADRPGLRVYLAPKVDGGRVQMHYAIAADGNAGQPLLASLTGQRRLGLTETPLGQLAMGDSVLHVEAAAWTLPKEAKQ